MSELNAHQVFPAPPYNFGAVLAVYSRFPHPSLEIIEGNTYRRVVPWGEQLALAEVSYSGTIDQPILNIDVYANSSKPDLDYFRHLLGYQDSRADFWEMARADKTLWSIVEAVYGMPTLRTGTVFEALVNVIIEQHISWKNAQKAQRWLVEWAGQCIEHAGQIYYAYPRPDQLAQATLAELKPLKITHGRINLIISIARAVVNGELNLDNLAVVEPDAAYQELLKIKGIGHWTASVVLARALGHYHYIPHNDVALQAAVNRYFYQGEGRVSAQVLRETFEPYGEFAGLAAHYMLMRWVLDNY